MAITPQTKYTLIRKTNAYDHKSKNKNPSKILNQGMIVIPHSFIFNQDGRWVKVKTIEGKICLIKENDLISNSILLYNKTDNYPKIKPGYVYLSKTVINVFDSVYQKYLKIEPGEKFTIKNFSEKRNDVCLEYNSQLWYTRPGKIIEKAELVSETTNETPSISDIQVEKIGGDFAAKCQTLNKNYNNNHKTKVYVTKKPLKYFTLSNKNHVIPTNISVVSGIEFKASLIMLLNQDKRFLSIYSSKLPNKTGIFNKKEFNESTEIRYI